MNRVVHFEIPADDLERAKKFYHEVFAWEMTDFPEMKYTTVKTAPTDENNMIKEPGTINGGIMLRTQAKEAPVLVIDVPNLDDHLKKIELAGGKIIMPKNMVGDMGWYARVTDSEGNIIGVWQNIKMPGMM